MPEGYSFKELDIGSLNDNGVITTPNGDKWFVKTLTSVDGEDAPHKEQDLSKFFNGIGVNSPEVTISDDGKYIFQPFLRDSQNIKMYKEDFADPDDLLKIIVGDIVIGSADRNSANIIVTPDKHVHAIDHEISLADVTPKLTEVQRNNILFSAAFAKYSTFLKGVDNRILKSRIEAIMLQIESTLREMHWFEDVHGEIAQRNYDFLKENLDDIVKYLLGK